MTKQQIMEALMVCAKKLGRTPSQSEFTKLSGISKDVVRRRFFGYSQLLEACKLSRSGPGYKIEEAAVFADWARVARELGKLPSTSEYETLGKFSLRPIQKRFKRWSMMPFMFKQFAEEQGWAEEWKDVLAIVDRREKLEEANEGKTEQLVRENAAKNTNTRRERWPGSLKPKAELYGRLMRPFAMLCAPTNEQGVLLLFGAMAEKLGFAVLKVRAAYPDCLAFRVVDGELLELLKIEFEKDSRNFLAHKHERSGCDMIVCWKHNWPECPLEVVELSKYF